ncbi:MAG: hypothetical protein U0105_27315 [Candidatus Obscuribacterales bacterium]
MSAAPVVSAKCVGCQKKVQAAVEGAAKGKQLPEHELMDFVNKKVAPATTAPAPAPPFKPTNSTGTPDSFSATPSPAPSALQGGTDSTMLQTGTQSTLLQSGTQSTTLQTGTQSTMLQTGTQSTTLQGGAYGTILQGGATRQGGPVSILVLVDASRSMSEKINGSLVGGMLGLGAQAKDQQKMDAAKVVLENTLARIPLDVSLGLRVFGQTFNNDGNDCLQTALLVPVGKNNRRIIRDAVGTLKPFGLTPLTYALYQAEKDLEPIEGNKTIILISDGVDTCGQDPCELIRRLEARGIHIKIDIVGLGLGHGAQGMDAKRQLNCISEASGGKFYDANTAGELLDSITTSVKQAIQGKVITRMKPATPPQDEQQQSAPADQNNDEQGGEVPMVMPVPAQPDQQ